MGDITNPTDMNLSKLREMVRDREAWRATVHGVTKSDMTEQFTTTLINGMGLGNLFF